MNWVCTALLATAVVLLPSAAYAQGMVEAWVQRYNGPGNGDDRVRALALDADGNVVVTGDYSDVGNMWGGATIKYSSAGELLWVNFYPGSAAAMAVDGSGKVTVTGSVNDPNASGYADFLTVAYSSAGVPLWSRGYNGPRSHDDNARAAAVDAGGNVFVTGFAENTGSDRAQFLTIKYSSAGLPLWTNWGPAGLPKGMAVDASGNVVVTGGGYQDFTTVKYSSAGVSLWTNCYWGPISGPGGPRAIAVDSGGNVFVTGPSVGSNDWDYATLAYSSAGQPLWTNRYDGPANWVDAANAIAVDANGNVYVTGLSAITNSFPSSCSYATIKYSGGGLPLWTNRYSGDVNSGIGEEARAAVVDARGNLVVTGTSYNGTNYDYVTIAYSSAGVPLWTNRYNGPADSGEEAVAVAADTRGNVYVTGNSWNGTDTDFATVKYAPVGPPSLSISAVGSQVRIAWPSTATGWAMRRASVVGGPYNDPGLPVTTEGDESVAYDNLGPGAGFYCLQKQP